MGRVSELTGLLGRASRRTVTIAVLVVALVASVLLLSTDDDVKHVTAHFPRAVSVYPGTDVRVLGVNVGHVDAVIPAGDSVRVEMSYDEQYTLPADAQAVIITPTLVADRFVQLTPAYTGGEPLADGAEIALPDTGVPIELDRIYASLRELSQTLGPNGVNRDGTLDHLLEAGARSLEGEGRLGNRTIRELAAAATTFGEGSGDLFQMVTELATLTDTLADNDALVRAFIRDLAGVSSDLAAEREELEQALASVADAVGTVERFVSSNRKALVTDVQKLTRVMRTINSEKASLDRALRAAPLALGNLSLAFNNKSGSIGSRVGIEGNLADADGFLCAIVQQSDMPKASKDLACTIFEQLLEPVTTGGGAAQAATAGRAGAVRGSVLDPSSAAGQAIFVADDSATLGTLLGGPR